VMNWGAELVVVVSAEVALAVRWRAEGQRTQQGWRGG
jgi:hypothetical protein